LIKKDLRDALMSKGNSKNVSEKALLLTGKILIYFRKHKYLICVKMD